MTESDVDRGIVGGRRGRGEHNLCSQRRCGFGDCRLGGEGRSRDSQDVDRFCLLRFADRLARVLHSLVLLTAPAIPAHRPKPKC